MAWDYSGLERYGDQAVANVTQESVDVYRFLRQQFEAGDVRTNHLFQFAFRSFYGMDRAGLTPDFKTHYFVCMQAARDDGPADIRTVASELKRFKTLRNCESLQFSFITKLVSMVDPTRPIWDYKVARLLGMAANASGQYETKLDTLLSRYEVLSSVADALSRCELGGHLEAKFRQKYGVNASEMSTAKVIDFLMWAAPSQARIRQTEG